MEGLHALDPGAHVGVLADDVALDGWRGRKAGLELRDTLLVLSAGVTTRFILLFRKPLQESTVAEQVLATGTGGINIDRCRVASDGSHFRSTVTGRSGGAVLGADDRTGAALGMFQAGAEFEPTNHTGGRWPPNVLLVHGPGCCKVGEVAVKAPVINRFDDGMKPFGEGAGHPYTSTGGGTENLAVYECQRNCPCHLLNNQTGVLTSGTVAAHHMKNSSQQASDGGFNGKYGDIPLTGYGDSGGAARFFPQFKNDYELVAWVQKLITPELPLVG